MIRYALICDHDHSFEAWFGSIKDYDEQAARGDVICPYCQTTKVEKAIMAPNISTARRKEAVVEQQALAKRKATAMMNEAAQTIRKEIEETCDYVGDRFTDEALSMHYGEKDERPIYGEATPDQAKTLVEEGVGIAPLPDVLTPKPKEKLN
ncbi:DUF1178 family protein [Fretibacter rubidus]|uniref:DUF1178 family protein n=1 Tax=Fretibacter rubidus TaxID=570162 RepID=UPI003529E8EE